MFEIHYKVRLRCGDRLVTVSVFTPDKASNEVILAQAKVRGVEFLAQIGNKVEESDFTLVSIQDCGPWPTF
ncbi:hypothetical protein [Gorillibacterium timonense]|uniref:hypothetical protein n=1 Tax=Gorillibacterium timonense TaxID=1689269 RepID=UPI00071CAE18|nr:hypothetical protein [Gorillibacterium timonense]